MNASMNAHENGQWLRKSGGTTENDDANDIAKSVAHSQFSDTLYYIQRKHYSVLVLCSV